MEFDPTKVTTSTPQAGQPVTPSPVAEPASGAKTDAGLTLEQVRQALREEMDTYQRTQQSQRDKLEARIQKTVQTQLDALRASGVEINDKVTSSVTNATRNLIEKGEEPQPVSTTTPAQVQQPEPVTATPSNDPYQKAYQKAAKILAAEGVTFDPNDPEMVALKGKQYADEFDWLKDIEAAVQTKKARLNQVPGTTIPTITGGATPGNPIANITDPGELLRIGFTKKGR
jgi:hypothetical protein